MYLNKRHLFFFVSIISKSSKQNLVGMALFLMIMQLCLSKAAFDKVPSPMLMVVTLDEQHTYKCNHSTADGITWRVNDRVLGVEIFTTPGIVYTDTRSHPDDTVYTLTITALPQNNGTTIQCTAAFDEGAPQDTPIVTFLIQGQLQGVSNLERNGSTIFWEAPFSLNLTGVEPDIVYCVDIHNITCGRRVLIISDCSVTEPSYTSEDITPQGYIYEYTVTTRSNVEEATNGTTVTVTEEFFILETSGQHQLSMIDDSEVMVIIHANIHNVQASHNKIHANSYAVSLISLDGVNDEAGMKYLANVVERNMSLVVLEVPLPFRRLWKYNILTHGCRQHPIMKYTLLSTHDVWEISITSPSAGTIRIAGYFIPGSPATGVLVAVFNSSEVSFYLLGRKGNELHNEGVLPNVRGGHHMVSVFVVEQNGLPFSRAATIPQNILVNENSNQSFSVEYNLRPTSAGICISCTFLESSATNCVAVVHQQISKLGSSGLINIESSHKFNKSGDTAYGCIEGVDMEQYQIGVIGGRKKQSSASPTDTSKLAICETSCIGGIIVALIIVIVMAVTFLFATYISIIRRRQKIGSRASIKTTGDLPSSGVTHYNMYEEVQLHMQNDSGGVAQAAAISGTQEIDSHTISGERPLPLLDTCPPLPPPRSMDTDHNTEYTEAVAVTGSSIVHQPPATERVVYDDIKAFQNKDGQQYAIIDNLKTTGKLVDDPNLTVYSEVQHVLSSQQVQITEIPSHTKSTTQLKQDNDPTPKPVIMEHLLSELLSLASKWQSLGEALSLDEDRLDEIYTNNERDEACLEIMLELYLARPDVNHSWDEIQKALEKIGEETLIDRPEVPPSGEKISAVSEEDCPTQVSQNQESASPRSQGREEGSPADLPAQSKDDADACQQETDMSDNQPQYVDTDDGDLTVHEDSQDDEERQKPECGKECASDSCQHESIPECDGKLSKQELKEDSQRRTDEEYHRSEFAERAEEPCVDTSKHGSQFQSGIDTSDTITACVTDDEAGIRNISSTNEHDTNCSKPLPFNAEYEGPMVEPVTGVSLSNLRHRGGIQKPCPSKITGTKSTADEISTPKSADLEWKLQRN